MTRRLEMKPLLGGAFGIMERQEQPVMIHGLAAHSFQIAKFANRLDALLFISAAVPGTEQGMTAELELWSEQQGLEMMSADEMFAEIAAQMPRTDEQSRQMRWLQDYIVRWDASEKMKGEAFYNAPVVAKEEA